MKKIILKDSSCCIIARNSICNFPGSTDAFSSRDLARGAQGDDVIELQARLQYISFYNGKIDGKFGYGTYWALRNFQEKYGLPVDGIAGSRYKKEIDSRYLL